MTTISRVGSSRSIAVSLFGDEIRSPNAGALMVADDTGYRGRPEPRFTL